ncbi:MAG: archaetidylserine decarboxylase [Salinisphaera sp.]|jgi:phosphatidylserine decarboxylase|nr:archaetidylserine decarboxylase [Salinisphaera sp.]
MRLASPASLSDRVFARLLWLLPTRAISQMAHGLAESSHRPLRRLLIAGFLRLFPTTDLSEAKHSNPDDYPSFNAFFTRELATGVRPLPEDNAEHAVSPIDGTLGSFGTIEHNTLYQTKGIIYDLVDLLGDERLASDFIDGHYATLYLAPYNYHRVHMPMTGRVRETRYVPGRLFGVNPRCVRSIPRLFARNERLVTIFDTDAGPMAMVMVGAFIVGGIHTRANGQVCPPHRRAPRAEHFAEQPAEDFTYNRGDEMGYFSFGSSVILLFGPDVIKWSNQLASPQALQLGQVMGRMARTDRP